MDEVEKLAQMLEAWADVSTITGHHGRSKTLTEAAVALRTLSTQLAEVKKERDEAIRECSKWAREAGEAIGKLETSELAGVVDGWRERAEKAEAGRDAYAEALGECNKLFSIRIQRAALTQKGSDDGRG